MSLEGAIQDARRAINRDLLPARLGNGQGSVYDLSVPGNYFLRKLEADGALSQPFSLPINPLASIPPVDGMPVDIGYDPRGIQCIWQCNTASMLSANVSPLIVNPLDTAVYGKQSQTNIATLFYQRHGDLTNFPFTVVVFKAPVIINGTAKMFAGAGISLSGFVPATGLHRYASVFLRTDMTLEAFASTPTNLLDPLTVDTDIQDCINQATADSVIICAWEILAGDTALSPNPARNVDMRQIVNTGSGSSPSGSLTVTDGSTTVTDVTDLTFNGSDFTVTDLGGGAVQIDLLTPSAQVFPTQFSVMCDEIIPTVTGTFTSVPDSLMKFCLINFTSPGTNGDYFDLPSILLAVGTYTVSVLGQTTTDRGILAWELDGIDQGVLQDWYSASLVRNAILTFTLTVLTDGIHTLRGIITGHNASSSGYVFAITKIWAQ